MKTQHPQCLTEVKAAFLSLPWSTSQYTFVYSECLISLITFHHKQQILYHRLVSQLL